MSVTANDNIPKERPKERRTGNLLLFLPLGIFLALVLVFLFRLGAGDASLIPSALIGRPAPVTVLPAIAGLERDGQPVPGLDADSFKGEVTVLNVFASWCVPCRSEAPLLIRLAAAKRIRVVGLHQKYAPVDAKNFLNRYGNPFAAIGVDRTGRASIEWGVYGVPETFLVGRDAHIRYKLIGEVTAANLEAVLRPQIDQALAAAP